jgi:hypothetical protein
VKRQYAGDPADPLGSVIPEIAGGVDLRYPDGGGGESETYYDPLQPLVGPVADVTPGKKGRKRKPLTLTAQQESETKARKTRYDRFIDALVKNQGDEVVALASVYGVETSEIEARRSAYRADVSLGLSTSSISDLMEKHNIGKATRVGMLAKHVFSADDKVSLVALKMAQDIDGDKHNQGTSYETYLRMVMSK